MLRSTSPRALGALALAVAIVVCSCGTSDDPSSAATSVDVSVDAQTSIPASTSATTPPSKGSVPTTDAYPVTIDHKYGSTTIDQTPQRIVVVGLTEQDALLALGVAPVAVTDWFGGYDYAAWPWAQPYLDGAEPVVLDDADGIPFEQIASLDPDLILGLYAGLTDTEYDTLSAIAPTVAQPAAYVDWGIPWQEATLTVGAILGESARAQALVDDVEAEFAEIREAHPEFVGASAAAATPYDGVYVYGPEDARGRLLDSLGFVMPDDLLALATDEFGFDVSLERLDLLDVDALIWLDAEDAGEAFNSNALYNSLDVKTEGRDILLDSEAPDALGGATSFVTVLSIPFLLDGLVPKLVAAIDGDPTTTS